MSSEKKPHTHTLEVAPWPSGPAAEKERAGRAALEAHVCRTLGDPEWNRARARLLQFASILHAWRKELTTSESELLKAA
jgi:hypothetical protein